MDSPADERLRIAALAAELDCSPTHVRKLERIREQVHEVGPLRPNLERQARHASGLSARQWKRWRKEQARKARKTQAGLILKVPTARTL